MADQQDQLSSGGSVEKASASTDAFKAKGKGSNSGLGGSNYRKRLNANAGQTIVEEKRRKQTNECQSSQLTTCNIQRQSANLESAKCEDRSNRRNNVSSLECLTNGKKTSCE